MDPVWQRLEAEVTARGRTMTWLAEQLGFSTGRVYNWQKRQVPPSQYQAIAGILGESVDWVTGAAAARSRGGAPLSPMAARLAAEFDSIGNQAAQLDAFAKCLGVIALAKGGR